MSGGAFNYNQDRIDDIVSEIEEVLIREESPKEYNHEWINGFSKETLDEFKKGIKVLKEARIYAQRIDWLLSADDGEESFHERLKEELNQLNENYKG